MHNFFDCARMDEFPCDAEYVDAEYVQNKPEPNRIY